MIIIESRIIFKKFSTAPKLPLKTESVPIDSQESNLAQQLPPEKVIDLQDASWNNFRYDFHEPKEWLQGKGCGQIELALVAFIRPNISGDQGCLGSRSGWYYFGLCNIRNLMVYLPLLHLLYPEKILPPKGLGWGRQILTS